MSANIKFLKIQIVLKKKKNFNQNFRLPNSKYLPTMSQHGFEKPSTDKDNEMKIFY